MYDVMHEELDIDHASLLRQSVEGVSFAQLSFAVMHGNGNIILVVDEFLSGLSDHQIDSSLARTVCQAFQAVRIDGVAFVRTSGPRVRMTYFERDGTHSQMCGNALRCVTRYCAERAYIRSDEDIIDTDDGEKWVSARGGRIEVALGAGREFQRVGDGRYFAFSGLPHLVVFVDDLSAVDVRSAGRPLRYDEDLCRTLRHPEGLHVDFVQRKGAGIGVRTYEVGVEDETLACGTGVAASAYVANLVWGLRFPIPVDVPGGRMTVNQTERGLVISGTTEYLFTSIEAGSRPGHCA
jgi:diaminopimelate epimerase